MLTHSPAETRALGRQLAQSLQAGDVLLLWGDLGAGKSELTRGIAEGLGVTSTVTSPSFTILNVYDEGVMPLYHFDWYRLNGVDELYEMGMDEYLGGDGVAVVEWPGMAGLDPEPALYIRLERGVGDDTRRITIENRGVAGFEPEALDEWGCEHAE